MKKKSLGKTLMILVVVYHGNAGDIFKQSTISNRSVLGKKVVMVAAFNG